MIVVGTERRDRVLGALGHDHIGQDEAPARTKRRVDPPEGLGLGLSLQVVVDDKSRDDEIKRDGSESGRSRPLARIRTRPRRSGSSQPS